MFQIRYSIEDSIELGWGQGGDIERSFQVIPNGIEGLPFLCFNDFGL